MKAQKSIFCFRIMMNQWDVTQVSQIHHKMQKRFSRKHKAAWTGSLLSNLPRWLLLFTVSSVMGFMGKGKTHRLTSVTSCMYFRCLVCVGGVSVEVNITKKQRGNEKCIRVTYELILSLWLFSLTGTSTEQISVRNGPKPWCGFRLESSSVEKWCILNKA